MKHLITIAFFLALIDTKPTFSQVGQAVIDSLTASLQENLHDTTRVTVLLDIVNATYQNNEDTAILICQQALAIGISANLPEEMASCYGWLGYLQWKKRDGKLAVNHFNKSVEVLKNLTLKNFKLSKNHLDNAEYIEIKNKIARSLTTIGTIYNKLGEIDSALNYHHQSLTIKLEIAESPIDDLAAAGKKAAAITMNDIGVIYDNQGDIQTGLEFHRKSLKIREELGWKKGIATSLTNIGFLYRNLGDIKSALEYYHRSLKINEELEDKKGMANALNNIAVIYDKQGDPLKGLEFHNKSFKIREEIDHKPGMANSLNNIGYTHFSRGDTTMALEHFYKSLELREEIGDESQIATSLNNIGSIHYSQGFYEKALEYFQRSLAIYEKFGWKEGVITSLVNIGSTYLRQGQLGLAKECVNKSMSLAKGLGFPERIQHAAELFSKVSRKEGDFEKALEMYELQIQMHDSVNNEKTQKATIRQQTKYEFERAQLVKEQKAKEQARLEAEATSRRDNLQYSVVLICLLLIGGLVAMLGRLSLPIRVAEGLIFFAFLILFEFILVLADPYIENWSGGAPGVKLLFNAAIAALIFPLHSIFETRLKGRLIKTTSQIKNR